MIQDLTVMNDLLEVETGKLRTVVTVVTAAT